MVTGRNCCCGPAGWRESLMQTMRAPEFQIKQIIRTQRNSVSIAIGQDATITIRAPHYLPDHQLEEIIRKKQVWIKSKLVDLRKRPQPEKREYIEGEGFWYLGRLYRLKIVDNQSTTVELKEELSVVRSALPEIREILMHWYRNAALLIFIERCATYAKSLGVNPVSIKVSNAQKRWGSCGPNGTINFSWRLVMAPLAVIDYVVVHELTHLIERNHSRRFWSRVSLSFPDFKRHRHWLKENEHRLVV